jgi:mitochondrial division protein 1
MTPRMMHTAQTVSSKTRGAIDNKPAQGALGVDFATIGRAPMRLGMTGRRITSRDLQIVEATDELLDADVPEPEGVAGSVSLLRGFNATIPSSEKGRSRRRQTRNVEAPRLGLKKLGLNARGMLGEEEREEGESVISEESDLVLVNGRGRDAKKKKRKGRESLAAGKKFGKEELARQTEEIMKDKENIGVRRVSWGLSSSTLLKS